MRFGELVKELKDGRPMPVYLLRGEEYQLIAMALERIRDSLLVVHGSGLETKRFDGAEVNLLEIISEARTPSLFSSKKLIRVDDWHSLLSLSSETERESLRRYLSDPSPLATIVFLSLRRREREGKETDPGDGGTGEQRRKRGREIRGIERAMAESGWVVDCPRQYSSVPSFIRAMAAEMGIRLSREGEALLQEAAGNDLGLIRSELEKIALTVEPGEIADGERIKGTLSRSGEANIFNYLNHLGNRNGPEALRSLEELCRNEPSERHFIYGSMIFRFFQQIWTAKEMKAAGATPAQVTERLKINRFFVGERLEQTKNFTVGELSDIMKALLETDLKIKTSSLPAEAALKELTMSICWGRGTQESRQAARVPGKEG